MTKAFVAALLAASSILPGIASAQDRGDRGDRQARQERRAERGDQGRDRPVPQAGVGRPDRPDRPDRPNRNDDRGPGWNRPGGDRGGYDRPGDRDGRGQGWNRPGNVRPGTPQRWSNDWRRDGRYDWNRYRQYNRGAFRLPRYYAPGGWGYGYRRFGVGVRFPGVLFGRNYWIADPWAYRLPPAYGPYRWVRYYNDAVLVDMRTGYTVDVIYGIFW